MSVIDSSIVFPLVDLAFMRRAYVFSIYGVHHYHANGYLPGSVRDKREMASVLHLYGPVTDSNRLETFLRAERLFWGAEIDGRKIVEIRVTPTSDRYYHQVSVCKARLADAETYAREKLTLPDEQRRLKRVISNWKKNLSEESCGCWRHDEAR